MSFQQWLSSVRCEFAEKLLVSTNKTISEIALEVGFASTKYLISHFKKWYACTPSRYRELTASIHTHLPHKYYSCDCVKAEKLLNGYRYESSCSGTEIHKGYSISMLPGKNRLPQKSETARLQHYINLLLLSGAVCKAMSEADDDRTGYAPAAETLLNELSRLPSEVCSSYEAFLAETIRYLKVPLQKET